MQNKQLYNMHVTHAMAALLEAHQSARALPLPPRRGIVAVAVTVNCYFGLRLPPSGVSIILLSGGPFLRAADMADYIAQVRSEGRRMQIGGFEAYRFDREIAPNDYYRSNRAVVVARVTGP